MVHFNSQPVSSARDYSGLGNKCRDNSWGCHSGDIVLQQDVEYSKLNISTEVFNLDGV